MIGEGNIYVYELKREGRGLRKKVNKWKEVWNFLILERYYY